MCKVFVFLFFLFTTLNSQAQFYYYPFTPTKNDSKIIEKENVKIGYEYKIEEGNKILTKVLEYGSMGLPAVLFEKGVDMNGDSATIIETTYKYSNLLKLEVATFKDFEENETTTTRYLYDSKGKLIEKIIATIDPLTYKYSFDASGNITKATVTARMPAQDKDGEYNGKAFDKPMDKYLYKYDSKKRLTEEWHFYSEDGSPQSTPSYKYKWSYNDKNQIISINLIDIDDEIIFTQQLKYNEKGLLSKTTILKKDGEKEEYLYEYCTDCKQSWMQ